MQPTYEGTITLSQWGGGPDFERSTAWNVMFDNRTVGYYMTPAELKQAICDHLDRIMRDMSGHNK